MSTKPTTDAETRHPRRNSYTILHGSYCELATVRAGGTQYLVTARHNANAEDIVANASKFYGFNPTDAEVVERGCTRR